MTLRLRLWEPVPQVRVQPVHALQGEVSQWIGQWPSVHICTAEVGGHAAPPWSGSVVMLRPRLCVPTPHVTVHALQSFHGDTAQSSGHGASEHTRTSARSGHV